MQYLISIPPSAVSAVPTTERLSPPRWFLGADPAGKRLGSGGGSAHLLLSAWRETGAGQPFDRWLRNSRRLMIHGGGQSRRLPAYASAGKLFIPMPVWRWATGQRINQNLLDLQLPCLERIFAGAPPSSRLMIASGDVLVKFADRLPPMPEADVICIGLWGKPEDAQHFGVFFCNRKSPTQLAFFKQKPSATEIQHLAKDHLFLLDAGIWMLSERAVDMLLALGNCADTDAPETAFHTSDPFELYSDFGLGLGQSPIRTHPSLNALTTAVIPLDDAEFYHFGRSADLIRSSLELQNLVLNQRRQHSPGVKRHPDLFVQNARIDLEWSPDNHRIWVENAHIGADWQLTTDHVLTGIPENDWALALPPGVCLDIVPLANKRLAIRCYGMRDDFHGPLGTPDTQWLGGPAGDWFARRGLFPADAGLNPATDIQHASLFPVLPQSLIDQDFLQWLVDTDISPSDCRNPRFAVRYTQSERISAYALSDHADLEALYRQRHAFQSASLAALARNHFNSVFYQTDLKHLAERYAADGELQLPPPLDENSRDIITLARDRMFRAETLRRRSGSDDWQRWERDAFALLRRAVLEPMLAQKVLPRSDTAPDQIVWARCPVRLDLAGGWTDTPPYCQLHGGKVVNLAVNLNGQPPLQTFIRRHDQPRIILRSIDLGSETRIAAYGDIADCATVGSEFSIAKAALAIAGFHPDFNGRAFPTLEEQLREFGGGLDISFVAAVPKGSGLGTSSILAATILAAISDFCALNWNVNDICARTLAIDQMLTTGGGWQDQFGAALHGVKLLATSPGLIQSPRVQWLPEHMIAEAFASGRILLYYTGITRIAKNILQAIVRGMFLNHKPHLALLDELGCHAEYTREVIQTADWDGLCDAIGRSWQLNQQLDTGTHPPETQDILHRIRDWTAGAKLLGAGGGGYLMICAKDSAAAQAIRHELTSRPPNSQARFVTPEISTTGLQITRS